MCYFWVSRNISGEAISIISPYMGILHSTGKTIFLHLIFLLKIASLIFSIISLRNLEFRIKFHSCSEARYSFPWVTSPQWYLSLITHFVDYVQLGANTIAEPPWWTLGGWSPRLFKPCFIHHGNFVHALYCFRVLLLLLISYFYILIFWIVLHI